MKKILGLFICLVMFFAMILSLPKTNLKADPTVTISGEGAQVRTELTEGKYGMRFVYHVSEDVFENATSVSFTIYYGLGTKTANELKESPYTTVADAYANPATVGGIEHCFVGSLVKIPDVDGTYNPVIKEVSALGILDVDGDKTEGPVITKSLVEVGRKAYDNENVDTDSTLDKLVNQGDRLVKITHSDDSIDYEGSSFNGTTLVEGDTVEMCRGSYASLSIPAASITVKGAFNGVKMDPSTGLREESTVKGETIINSPITVAYNTTYLYGLKILGENAVVIDNSAARSKIYVYYCNMEYTGAAGIKTSEDNIKNLSQFRLRYSKLVGPDTASVGVRLYALTKNVDILENYIGNSYEKFNEDKITFDENDSAIMLWGHQDEGYINIKNNIFKHRSASQLIDIYAHNNQNPTRSIFVNIENNKLNAAYETTPIIGGNGIRVCGFKEKSSISIIHNYGATISPYMNAVEIKKVSKGYSVSQTNAANASGDARVDLLFNVLTSVSNASDVECPSFRTSASNKYIRIGLGVPSTSLVNISKNHYASSSKYTFTNLSSNTNAYSSYYGTKDATANDGNPITNDKASNVDAAHSAYEDWKTNVYEAFITAVGEGVANDSFELSIEAEILTYTGTFAPLNIYARQHNSTMATAPADDGYTAPAE